MKFWLSVLSFVHLFILVNSFHLWSKWFEWRRVFYSASSLAVQFIFLVMFIVTPTFHPLGRFLFSSWPSFGRFSVSSWPPKWAGSRSPRGLNLKLGRFSFSSWLQSQIGQVLVFTMAQSQLGQVLSSYLFSQTQSASRFNPLGRSSSWPGLGRFSSSYGILKAILAG